MFQARKSNGLGLFVILLFAGQFMIACDSEDFDGRFGNLPDDTPPITRQTKIETQNFNLVNNTNGKLDLLFVMDDSKSINGAGPDGRSEKEKILQNLSAFANNYLTNQDLDICISVITVNYYRSGSPDPSRHGPLDPVLLECNGLAPEGYDLVTEFRDAIDVQSRSGMGDERAFESIEKYVLDYPYRFRSDSKAGIVIVTDEGEQSDNIGPADLVSFLDYQLINQKNRNPNDGRPYFFGAVTYPENDVNCMKSSTETQTEGCQWGDIPGLVPLVKDSMFLNIVGGDTEYSRFLDHLGLVGTQEKRTQFLLSHSEGPDVKVTEVRVNKTDSSVALIRDENYTLEETVLKLINQDQPDSPLANLNPGDSLEVSFEITETQ